MTDWWRHRSFKARLTIWYVVSICLVLGVFAAGTYEIVEHRLAAEMDRQLRIDFDIVEAQLDVGADDAPAWPVVGAHGEEGFARLFAWFEIWSEDGRLLLRHWPIPEAAIKRPLPAPEPVRAGLHFYSTDVESSLPARIMERPARLHHGRGVVVRVIRDESDMRQTLTQILEVFAIGLPLATLLAAFGGFLLARRSLSPIAAMTAQARQITSESLAARLAIANPHDEVGRLAGVFNETLARLEASFGELKRFSADASHELRTPLTALRAVGEAALSAPRSEPELREALASMLEEAQRLTDLTEALLMLARLESGAALRLERVDLGELAREVCEAVAILAETREQQLECIADVPLPVAGNPVLLRTALLNVVHNAIRYSPSRGRVGVKLARNPDDVVIDIIDEGPGIPVELRARVFERFFRIDAGRSRDTGGHGLGLAIARCAIERHGGTIAVLDGAMSGTTVRIRLALNPTI